MIRVAATLLASFCLLPGFGRSPQEALKGLRVPEEFEVGLIAHEPEIRQPVAMQFDAKGRLWVIQYLQYPNPAGLTAVKVDQYLRTVYDQIPDPPPKGPRGADRITICEDTDGDNKADRFIDFVSGLNLASGFALGFGGVFVVQPPYLLFYPDRDRDDSPDCDPEVLLSGFGMEDSHAFANSLQWGPDGWLYGAQGSTVTANIRGIRFQQGIWRYHPITREFELFAEGGGNTWGLDFDREGNAIAGTNFGELTMLHQVQGGYYVKNFGKHGELQNPHAYGYFNHVPYQNFKGGHVTCGGIVYWGSSFPESFRGVYIAANPLANAVYWHLIEPNGSSFKARHGGELVVTDDITFRPVDAALGPDGALYLADWADQRLNHVDPRDTWDRSNGRIFRVQAKGAAPVPRFDLETKSSAELVAMLNHPNQWQVREARRILGERRDSSVIGQLQEQLSRSGPPALESFWALASMQALDADWLSRLVQHPDVPIRMWAVRLAGDRVQLAGRLSDALRQQARIEESPAVRSQLASTAKRLPATAGLQVVQELIARDLDSDDPFIPLLLWWALEAKVPQNSPEILEIFRKSEKSAVARRHLFSRLARRFAAEPSVQNVGFLTTFLRQCGDPHVTRLILEGVAQGAEMNRFPEHAEWKKELSGRLQVSRDVLHVQVALKTGMREAFAAAHELLMSLPANHADRPSLLELMAQVSPLSLIWKEWSTGTASKMALLSALQTRTEKEISKQLLDYYRGEPREIQSRIRSLLSSRIEWAGDLVAAAQSGVVPKSDFSSQDLRQLARHEALESVITTVLGKLQSASSAEKEKRFNELKLVLSPSGSKTVPRPAPNREEGKKVFAQSCGVCHVLFSEGKEIGPNLTGVDRKNRDYMLLHILDPSAFIRTEYLAYEIETSDGQNFFGLITAQEGNELQLVDSAQQVTKLSKEKAVQIRASSVSLMPEGLLDSLSDRQLVDLFAYLEGDP